MISERKIAANRENAKKSTGPRTARGRSRASRNALRHGLEGVNFGDSGLADEVERMAKAICKDGTDPFRFEQAIIIAESQILLARVRAARIAAISEPLVVIVTGVLLGYLVLSLFLPLIKLLNDLS